MTVGHVRALLATLPDDWEVVVYALDQQGLAAPECQPLVVRKHASGWWHDVTWDAAHGARQPGDVDALLVRYREEPV